MKKLEIEKTKPAFIISVLKVDIIKVSLVFSIFNFFITKTSLANNWRSFSSRNLALCKASFICWSLLCVTSVTLVQSSLREKNVCVTMALLIEWPPCYPEVGSLNPGTGNLDSWLAEKSPCVFF